MNLLDLLLVVALVAGTFGGYRFGLVARLASWGGLVAGIALGVALLPVLMGAVDVGTTLVRLGLTLLVFFGAAGIGSAIGERVGFRLRREIPTGPAEIGDRIGGALAGAFAVLVAVWLLAPIAAEIPGIVARQARNSAITGFVTDVAPRPPGPVRSLRRVVGQTRFPEVFSGLRPAPDTGPPPASVPLAPAVLGRVTASSVGVESFACDARHEGSGFVVAPDLVATNAHVVAGADRLRLRMPEGGMEPASVVSFDPDRDLALLRAPGLQTSPLGIGGAPAGTDGAVVGYPRGLDRPRTRPAVVRREQAVTGRDIYGNGSVRREVLFLGADLAQGDSGAPLVDPSGQAVGVVFAVAADRSGTAYALDDTELRALLDAPRNEDPGPCL